MSLPSTRTHSWAAPHVTPTVTRSLEECDIRIQKIGVSNVHLVIKHDGNGQVGSITNVACLARSHTIRQVGTSNHPLPLTHRTRAYFLATHTPQMIAAEMSGVNPTLLNGKPMGPGTVICHGDVFDICGRKFLYENVSIIFAPRIPQP